MQGEAVIRALSVAVKRAYPVIRPYFATADIE